MSTSVVSEADRQELRQQPAEAERAIVEILPDETRRRPALEAFAQSVVRAHESNPSAWEVTLGVAPAFLTLNVGRVLALTLGRKTSRVAVILDRVPEEARQRLEAAELERAPFRSLPDAWLFKVDSGEMTTLWQEIAEAHFAAIERAGEGFSASPYRRSHSPGALEYLEETLERELPVPDYPPAPSLGAAVEDMVSLVRRTYPDWSGFDHPQFVADERDYKQKSVQEAQDSLSRQQLEKLLESEAYEEFVDRLDVLGKQNKNMLFRGVPMAGDLGILYQPTLDKPEFCKQVFNLLHGAGDTPGRLGQYAAWVAAQGLPNKWTFPTFFLWACAPDQEVFIKPSAAKAALKLLGADLTLKRPSADGYAAFRDVVFGLKESLASYGPRDATDVQSFLWVACKAAEDEPKAEKPASPEEVADVPPAPEGPARPAYSLQQMAEDSGLPEAQLRQWVRAIDRKGQAVLYGPPGTGKTFVAEALARHLVGGGDGFVELVQFHPSYAYEDFIQGIRPSALPDGGLSYEMARGRFLEVCDRARDAKAPCVLIVDEINRANLSRVFGELMYLLEYREKSVPLAGGGSLEIPENVRLIGTMNTADRSIALVDHALRRRFAFLRLQPNYEVLQRYHERQSTKFPADRLASVLRQVNQAIADPHYEVGITFFLRSDLRAQIEDIWQMEIEPYLEEYFFDQLAKVNAHRWDTVREALGFDE